MQNVRNDDEVQNWFCMRALLRSLACSAVLIPISRALAQFPSPNPTSTQIEESMKAQATSANIQTWLESKDPRLIAWGAYFAREDNDTAALDLAAQLVKKSLEQGGPDLLSPGGPQYDALSEVLDTLIQRRVLLSADMLGYVSRSHPVQTIILLSMLPSAEQTGNLMQWYYGPRPHDGSNHLDRVSAMLLSKSPPPGFAANILANSDESLVIYIVPTKNVGVGFGSGSGGGMCGSHGISGPPGGWPDIPSYHLTENDNAGIDPLLVESGGDRISWQRSTPGHGFRSCGGVRGLTPETRHHLLAEMLGQRDEAMSWPTQKVVNIAKESDEQVQRDIGATIQAEQAILLKSVQDFQTRGLITPEEARTVLPKLSVTIRYDGSLNRTQ